MKELCTRKLSVIKKDKLHYVLAMPEYRDIIAEKYPMYEIITYTVGNITKITKGVAKGCYVADVTFYGDFCNNVKGHAEVVSTTPTKSALTGYTKALALGKKKLAFGESATFELKSGIITKTDFAWLQNNGFSWSFERLGTFQPKMIITKTGCIDNLSDFQALPLGEVKLPSFVKKLVG